MIFADLLQYMNFNYGKYLRTTALHFRTMPMGQTR